MNFAAQVGASLRSGYAFPAQRPGHGPLRNQPAGDPLIEGETLPRPSRPPLSSSAKRIEDRRRFGTFTVGHVLLHPIAQANRSNRLASCPEQGHGGFRPRHPPRESSGSQTRRRRRNRPPETLRQKGPRRAGISGKPGRARARGPHRRSKGLQPRISQVP